MNYQQSNYSNYNTLYEKSQKESELYYKRKELKETINSVGILMIVAVGVFFAFSLLFSFVYIFFIANQQFTEAFDSIPENLLGGISNVIPIGLCGFFYILIRKPKASEVLLFEKTGFKKIISVVAIGFSICMLSNLITTMFLGVTSSIGVNLDFSYESAESNTIIETVIYLISVAVVPSFSEEILFRGAILSSLRKYGDGFAVMVSAFFFGLFHGNFVQFPFAMIVGLVQGWAFVYTNSLLPAILIHFFNNGFSVICDVIATNSDKLNIDSIVMDYVTYGLVILLAVIAIISAAHLSRKDKSFLRLRKYEGTLEKKEIKKALFTSPTVIVAFVLLAVETIFSHLPQWLV